MFRFELSHIRSESLNSRAVVGIPEMLINVANDKRSGEGTHKHIHTQAHTKEGTLFHER